MRIIFQKNKEGKLLFLNQRFVAYGEKQGSYNVSRICVVASERTEFSLPKINKVRETETFRPPKTSDHVNALLHGRRHPK